MPLLLLEKKKRIENKKNNQKKKNNIFSFLNKIMKDKKVNMQILQRNIIQENK